MARARAVAVRIPLWAAIGAAIVALAPRAVHAQTNEPCVNVGQDVTVERDDELRCHLVLGAGQLTVAEGGALLGHAIVVAGDAAVAPGGAVAGRLIVLGGTADVQGEVQGDVLATGAITVGASAMVHGRVIGWQSVAVADGANVSGSVRSLGGNELDRLAAGTARDRAPTAAVAALCATVWLILTTALAPTAVGRVKHAVGRRPAQTLSYGLALALVLPILGVLLLVTVVGPFILLAVALLAILFGVAGTVEAAGGRIVPRGPRLLHALLGAVAWSLPIAGGWLAGGRAIWLSVVSAGLLGIWGLGAAGLTRIGRRAWPDERVASRMPEAGAAVVEPATISCTPVESVDKSVEESVRPEVAAGLSGQEASAATAITDVAASTAVPSPEAVSAGSEPTLLPPLTAADMGITAVGLIVVRVTCHLVRSGLRNAGQNLALCCGSPTCPA